MDVHVQVHAYHAWLPAVTVGARNKQPSACIAKLLCYCWMHQAAEGEVHLIALTRGQRNVIEGHYVTGGHPAGSMKHCWRSETECCGYRARLGVIRATADEARFCDIAM